MLPISSTIKPGTDYPKYTSKPNKARASLIKPILRHGPAVLSRSLKYHGIISSSFNEVSAVNVVAGSLRIGLSMPVRLVSPGLWLEDTAAENSLCIRLGVILGCVEILIVVRSTALRSSKVNQKTLCLVGR